MQQACAVPLSGGAEPRGLRSYESRWSGTSGALCPYQRGRGGPRRGRAPVREGQTQGNVLI